MAPIDVVRINHLSNHNAELIPAKDEPLGAWLQGRAQSRAIETDIESRERTQLHRERVTAYAEYVREVRLVIPKLQYCLEVEEKWGDEPWMERTRLLAGPGACQGIDNLARELRKAHNLNITKREGMNDKTFIEVRELVNAVRKEMRRELGADRSS